MKALSQVKKKFEIVLKEKRKEVVLAMLNGKDVLCVLKHGATLCQFEMLNHIWFNHFWVSKNERCLCPVASLAK